MENYKITGGPAALILWNSLNTTEQNKLIKYLCIGACRWSGVVEIEQYTCDNGNENGLLLQTVMELGETFKNPGIYSSALYVEILDAPAVCSEFGAGRLRHDGDTWGPIWTGGVDVPQF